MQVSARYVLAAGLILLLHTCIVLGHPQCLDFGPPFQGDATLQFCSQYKEFTCCTRIQDTAIETTYIGISAQLKERNLDHCLTYVRELLCQPCSPYAAHIYDAEGTGQSRAFPGLCENYCKEIFRECQQALVSLVARLNASSSLLNSLASEEEFCSQVALTDKDYCFPYLLTNPVLNGNIQMTTVNTEGCLCVEDFASDLRNPVFMKYPDDGSGRYFVGEQLGIIYTYYENKTRAPLPFLDLSGDVFVTNRKGDERGLLCLAFHPLYKDNGRFFVYYYRSAGRKKIRVSEFTVSREDPDKGDIRSERVLLEVNQPYRNHNGGELFFGDDGYLYVSIGDGGGAGDQRNYAQNLAKLLGKILRIDVDSPVLPYGIPPDNPFLDNPEARPEIYAYGVRNMWRCGKDRGDPATGHGRGRVICGDVGQSAFEELDLLRKGGNYGWSGREGDECFKAVLCYTMGPAEEAPIFVYPHSVGKSITGGHFYRGCESPNLNGLYIYGDYTNGLLFRLLEDPSTGEWGSRQIDMCGPEYCNSGLRSRYAPHILSFAEDVRGEIYILSSESAKSTVRDGNIYKLVDPRRRGDPLSCPQPTERRFFTPTPASETDQKTPPKMRMSASAKFLDWLKRFDK